MVTRTRTTWMCSPKNPTIAARTAAASCGGDGVLEGGGVFDVADGLRYGRAVKLLLIDAFADVPEGFHARLRGRARAGDPGGGCEQHDVKRARRIHGAGERARLKALPGERDRSFGGQARGRQVADRARQAVGAGEQHHLRAGDLVDDLQVAMGGLRGEHERRRDAWDRASRGAIALPEPVCASTRPPRRTCARTIWPSVSCRSADSAAAALSLLTALLSAEELCRRCTACATMPPVAASW